MKKSHYLFAALFAASFVSCTKEAEKENLEPAIEAGTTLRAVVEETTDTKVSANPVGVYSWQESDKIAVLDNNGDPYEFTASTAGVSTEFVSASSITLGKYAQYPSSESFSAVDDYLEFQIPSSITYSANATNMPMLGKISGDAATFKSVGGLLKLIVYGVPEDATELEFAATNKKISGGFEIADATVEDPVIVTSDKGIGDNLITIDFTGKRSANMVFYFPLPTGTIDGFTLTFNDSGLTSKASSKELVVGRNDIIVAPAINLVTPEILLSETFTTDLSGIGDPARADVSAYNAEKKGQTVYGGNTVNYSINAVTGTQVYVSQNLAGGAANGELLLAQKSDPNDGVFIIEDIPSAGASMATIAFVSNSNAANRCTISSPTDGVKVFGRTVSGSNKPYTITHKISIKAGVTKFNLELANSSGNNVRIDDIVVATAAPDPTISFDGTGARTIAAGANTASNVTGVSVIGAVDETGIGISTSDAWLTAALVGTTLSISSTEYNNTETDRIGYVYLKATGATTQQITVTQKPSIVSSPSLSRTAGNQTFTVTWSPDTKAKTYVAYYSTTDNMADPTTGTALDVNSSDNPYTVTASGLTNGTTYYIYVKVLAVADELSSIYTPSTGWAKISATPSGASAKTVTFTVNTADSVTLGGDMTGISATLSTTGSLNSGFIQMTSSKVMTLTISGMAGKTITDASVDMKSNTKGGSGSLSLTTNSLSIAAIADSAFNSDNWNGSWSTSAVTVPLTVSSRTVAENKTIILAITSSANSIYFQKLTLEYTD